jgi:class 3 adenylate cyclase
MTAAPELTFANLLRYHRLAAGLSQEELAERAHLSVDAISMLERGARRSPRKDTVTLLADALALAPDDRAAFVAAVRRSPAALAATPREEPEQNAQKAAPEDGLPHGVVTFLFADIEGSSQLLQRMGDQYAALVTELHALLRVVWEENRGHELGVQGDRFFVVFAQPDDAIAAATSAQKTLAV